MDIIGQYIPYIPQFGSFHVPSIVRCQRPISALSMRWAGGRFHSGSQLTVQLKQPIATRRDMEDREWMWNCMKLIETIIVKGQKVKNHQVLTWYIHIHTNTKVYSRMIMNGFRCIPGGWRPSTQNVGEGFGLQTSGGWTLGYSGPQWLWKEYHSTYLAGALGALLAENLGGYCTFGVCCWGKLLDWSMFGAAHQPRKKHMVPRQLMFLLIFSGMFCRQVSTKSGRIGRASRLIERSHTLSHLASDNSKHGITYHGWVNHWWYSHIFTFNPIGTIPSHQKHGVSCALWRTSVAIS